MSATPLQTQRRTLGSIKRPVIVRVNDDPSLLVFTTRDAHGAILKVTYRCPPDMSYDDEDALAFRFRPDQTVTVVLTGEVDDDYHRIGEIADEPDMICLDRGLFEEPLCRFLEEIGLSDYGYPISSTTVHPTNGDPTATVRNATFCVRPENRDGENLDTSANFEHYPSGLKITWYKSALRSGKANRALTLTEFEAILAECRHAMANPSQA